MIVTIILLLAIRYLVNISSYKKNVTKIILNSDTTVILKYFISKTYIQVII